MPGLKLTAAAIALAALAAAPSTAEAQQVLCRFSWNAGAMVLNANKTGVWTGGAQAGQFANQRGDNRWRVDGDVIHVDWTIVTNGPMKGRTGFTRPPLSSCPAAARG